jgi:hypothetical protein
MNITPIRINGQCYSYRDLSCRGVPQLQRIAGGMVSLDWGNAADASHFHGVGQAALAMIPGASKPNFSMTLRKEEWDYLMTSGALPPAPAGYSDKRFDWELHYGESEAGGISRLVLTNFHFLGVSRAGYRMGDAIVNDIACFVQFIQEDPGTGILFAPVIPPAFAVL